MCNKRDIDEKVQEEQAAFELNTQIYEEKECKLKGEARDRVGTTQRAEEDVLARLNHHQLDIETLNIKRKEEIASLSLHHEKEINTAGLKIQTLLEHKKQLLQQQENIFLSVKRERNSWEVKLCNVRKTKILCIE